MNTARKSIRLFLIFFLIFQLTFFPTIINADTLVVDPNAPAKNQPTLDKAQNGVPVVNLTAPSPRGVSHNKFSDYNVEKKGLILNNSKEMGVSKLGGALYGNPNYQKSKQADIVLNEVTGVKRSNLLGYTEMFGKPADLVIANPNGITCNGCGFINMPRVTLGTGKPYLDNDGEFSGLTINRGDVLLEGLGLDGSNTDYVEIITRAMKLHAAIWAKKKLKIETGKGKYDYNTEKFTQDLEETGEKPQFAIDASLLGSMYANTIFLVINEHETEVNAQGEILADIEDVMITADGTVRLKNVHAKRDIKVESKSGNIEQTGKSSAENNISYKADKKIDLKNVKVNAQKQVKTKSEELILKGSEIIAGLIKNSIFSLDAKIVSKQSYIDKDSKIIGYGDLYFGDHKLIENQGYIAANSDITVNADNIINKGEISSGQDMAINTDSIYNSKEKLIYSGRDMTINSYNNIDNDQGYIYSSGSMTLQRSPGTPNNNIKNYVGYIESGEDMTINTAQLENLGQDSGTYDINYVNKGGYGKGYYNVIAENIVTSKIKTDPAYITSARTININSEKIINYSSIINSAGDMTISGGALNNETSSQTITLPKHKLYGRYRREKSCNKLTGHCNTYHHYDRYWAPGTVAAYSENRALIQSGGKLTIDAQQVGNQEIEYSSAVAETDKQSSFSISDYIDLPDENNALFKTTPQVQTPLQEEPTYTYLIETKNRFINIDSLKGSKYLLERIGFSPDKDIKLLGDPFYEQQLINQAVFKATSERYLNNQIKTDQEQIKWLIDNALQANKDLHLSVGVTLTKEQINELAAPVIWLIEKEIMGQTVLVPEIYIPQNILKGFSKNKNSKIEAQSVYIDLEKEISNTGIIQSQTDLSLIAQKIENKTGLFQGEIIGKGTVNLKGQEYIINQGGIIKSSKSLSLIAEQGDITNQTLTYTDQIKGDIKTKLGFEAQIISDGSLFINAGQNLINRGANIESLGSASLNSGNNISFETIKLRDKTNYTYKDGQRVTDKTEIKSSYLKVYGALDINAKQDINFIGTNTQIQGAAKAIAGRDFNLLNDYQTYYHKSQKTDQGLFTSKTTTQEISSTKVIDSLFNAAGNAEIIAKQNINIIGSKTSFNQNITLNAEEDLNIISAKDTYFNKKTTTKSGFLTGGNLWGSEICQDIVSIENQTGSYIKAGQNLSSKSGKDTNIIGSKIDSKNAQIKTQGDLLVTSAQEQSYSYSHRETTTIGFKGLAKLAVHPLLALKTEQGRLSLQISEGKYDKIKSRTDKTVQKSSEINISNKLDITSQKSITIAGSNINTGSDAILSAKQDVNIIATKQTIKTDTEKAHGTVELSTGVTNQTTETYYAAIELKQAKDKLKQAKETYDIYRKAVKKAEEQYKQGIIDIQDLDDIKEDEKYYQANLGLATANVAAKTANLLQQTAAATSSGETFGFNADLQLDIDALVEKTLSTQTTSKASNIKAGSNLIIKAGANTLTQASNIQAFQDIEIQADNVYITSAKNIYETSYNKKDAHLKIKAAIHGGVSTEASLEQTTAYAQSTSYQNSHLSASNIKITSQKNTEIKGAVISAQDNINLNIGNDLIVKSLQDSQKNKSHTTGVNAGYSETKETAGADFSISRGRSKWVREQTQIIGDSVDITVQNKTSLKGAAIASKSNNLTINTDSLEYSDIKDKDISNSIGVGLGIESKFKDKGQTNKTATAAIGRDLGTDGFQSASFGFKDKRQTNKATIGKGSIIIRGDPAQDLSRLNRDASIAQFTTKDTGVSLELDKETLDLITKPVQTAKGAIKDTKKIYSVGEGIIKSINQGIEKDLGIKGTLEAIENSVKDIHTIAAVIDDKNLTEKIDQAIEKDAASLEQGVNQISEIVQQGDGAENISKVILYQGSELNNEMFGYAAAYDESDNITYLNTQGTDISTGGSIINSIFTEAQRKENLDSKIILDEKQRRDLAYFRGEQAETLWNRFSSTASTTSDIQSNANWNKANSDSKIIKSGTYQAGIADIQNVKPKVTVYSRSVEDTVIKDIGRHLFIVVSGRENGKKPRTISLKGPGPLGGIPKINTVKGFAYDEIALKNKTTQEEQVIGVPKGMTQTELDELVIENAEKYDTMEPLNKYPPFGGALQVGVRNSNTFVDNVIEESRGEIKNFKKALHQNAGEFDEKIMNYILKVFGVEEEERKKIIRKMRGFND